MAFSNNIKELRKLKGLTQEEMASKLEIAQATYCQYETGAKSPNVYIAQEIANIFGVTLDSLMKGA